MPRHLTRTIPALAGALTFLALGAPSAFAGDSLNLSLSNPNPVRGIPITVGFTGNDTPFDSQGDTPELYALVRPVNGVPCQSTFGADMQVSGTTDVIQIYNANNNGETVSSGTYSYSKSITPVAGTYLVCAWLETDNNDFSGKGDTSKVVTATATTGYATQNTDALGISLPTTLPPKGIPFTITFAGHDTPVDANGATPELYALARPTTAGPCQPTFGADMQVAGTANVTQIYNANNNGNTVSSGTYTYSASITPTVGSYVVCAWLETDDNDFSGKGDTPDVVTAATSANYSVVAPVRCVIPKFAGTTLAKLKRRLAAHHCGVGHVRFVRRRHTHRGRVLGLSARPGSRHRAGYPVGVTVARGR